MCSAGDGEKLPVTEIGENEELGAYYAIKDRGSEFSYETRTAVEAVGVTKEHFMRVLARHPKKLSGITRVVVHRHITVREKAVLRRDDNEIERESGKAGAACRGTEGSR